MGFNEELKRIYSDVSITYGYITKHTRISNSLSKSKALDNGTPQTSNKQQSSTEYRRDISEMIKVGMSSTDSETVMFWSKFGGKTPTPEKLLAVMASSVSTRL